MEAFQKQNVKTKILSRIMVRQILSELVEDSINSVQINLPKASHGQIVQNMETIKIVSFGLPEAVTASKIVVNSSTWNILYESDF